MCASLRFLRAGPPPPRVAMLSDALFFTRTVPITKGATQAEAAAQVELALESFSPFPLAQLYYGSYWIPGSEHALVFAAYRRRFTTEQAADWQGAELVLPAFAAVLGAEVEASTTVLLNSFEGWTAIHWSQPGVPSQVVYRSVEPETTEDDRAKIRDEFVREFGGSRKVLELESPLAADSGASDREIVFRSGDFVSRLPVSVASAIDVRDKAELAALRNARKRDVLLWRVAIGAAAVLLFLLIGEFALMGGKEWQKLRVREFAARKPAVDNVHKLTHLIEDLATKRLLPLEMVTQLVGENNERLPPEIQFTRVFAEQARGLYNVLIEGKANNAAQIAPYETAVRNLPSVQSADIRDLQVIGDRATFKLTVTFKPDALKPAGTSVASAP
jgi:hypothetical protein